jgi:hypothetical protein
VLATVTDTVGPLTHDVVGTIAPVAAAVPTLLAAGTNNVAALHVGSAGLVSGTATPALADFVEASHAATPDTTGGLTDHAVTNATPVVDTIEPVLTNTAASLSNPTSDVLHPSDTGNVATDALASATPLVEATEPAAASGGISPGPSATDMVPDTGSGQAVGQADTLLALATATHAPIEAPGSTTAVPANVATDVSHPAAAVDATPIVGDVIAFNSAPPPAHALFAGTQYTDYGVTLSSDTTASPQHLGPADAASTHDTSLPAVADVQQHAPPPPELLDTSHPVDHHAIL